MSAEMSACAGLESDSQPKASIGTTYQCQPKAFAVTPLRVPAVRIALTVTFLTAPGFLVVPVVLAIQRGLSKPVQFIDQVVPPPVRVSMLPLPS